MSLTGRCDICDKVKFSQKSTNNDFRSNQHVEKVVFKCETGNEQCELRFEGEKQVKTFLLIFAGILELMICQNRFLSECASAQEMENLIRLIFKNKLAENYH